MLPKDPIKAAEYRKKMSEIAKRQKTPEWRENHKRWAERYYSVKENRDKMRRKKGVLTEEGRMTLREKAIRQNHERFRSPEARKKQSESVKNQWKNPNIREKMLSGLKKVRRRFTGKPSKGEKELALFIRSIYNGVIIENDRSVLDGYELDVYLPDIKVAFEFNGEYWHTLPHMVERDAWKRKECRKRKIALLNVWEGDWYNKQEEIKSFIKTLVD